MRLPCEILQEPYLITIRKTVAKNLNKQGWTQKSIAELLKVSQPIVSSYLKSEITFSENTQINQIINKGIEIGYEITNIFNIKGKNGMYEAISTTCHSCKILRSAGPICNLHFTGVPELQDENICTACVSSDKLIQLVQPSRYQTIHDLQQTVNSLNKIENIAKIVPEIGLQIAYASDFTKDLLDIAAFPGRIGKYKGSLTRIIAPEFGASEHTAKLLIQIKEYFPEIRSVIGLKNSSWFVNLLKKLNVAIFYINVDNLSQSDLAKEFAKIKITKTPIGLVGEDSIGIEGITYIFSEHPEDFVTLIKQVNSLHNL
jgi:XRE family transcriptional regulator, thiamine biosynthesis regulator